MGTIVYLSQADRAPVVPRVVQEGQNKDGRWSARRTLFVLIVGSITGWIVVIKTGQILFS